MSYTVTANIGNRFTSNAEFQAWGSWISNGLANTGLTKGTDVNQIDWSSVAQPNTTSTMQGYEFWGFSDALQNTAPVWVKIEYGCAADITRPAFTWQIGSGYQTGNVPGGAGVTGFTWNVTTIGMSSTYANNTFLSYLAGGSNWFIIAMNVRGTGATATFQEVLGIERTVDANGNPTADGVLIVWKSALAPALGQAVWSPILGPIDYYSARLGILHPDSGGGVTGGNTAVYPIFHDWGGGPFLNPGFNFLGYMNPDFTAGTANTFTYYGSSHTYMPLGNTAINAVGGRSANAAVTLMMRWE